MVRSLRPVLCVLALVLLPAAAFAQVGSIAGVVRDSQGGVLPGVTVEVTSPVLIEKVRSTTTDSGGRYQIVSLPVGTYTVTFTLASFSKVETKNVTTSSDSTNTVDVSMKPGNIRETVEVRASEVPVDVKNARQLQVFTGDEIKDLPTSRNLSDLYTLVPGIAVEAADFLGNSVPRICSAGNADAGGVFNASGGLSGCSPLVGNFNAHSSMNDANSLAQGRVQIDGMGIQSFAGGGRSSYVADIANAQEISFTLSGSLGESETGGTTINIVPRTGGNRYSGNFFTSYGDHQFYDKNNGTRRSSFDNRLDYQYDTNGSYGGPIMRDRLWFQSSARRQERNSILHSAYRNLNEGIFGANYKADPTKPINQSDLYQNVSLRLTMQATRRNKFNVSWDEQYTCENPCKGSSTGSTSVEASPSTLTYPLHVAQLSWTNPFTNRILLDGGISLYSSHRNQTRNRFEKEYLSIPKISETGATIQTAPGVSLTSMVSGSINNTDQWNVDNIQSRGSASYVTGTHNIKLGYQGGYLSRSTSPHFNDLRLDYGYATPAGNCTSGPNANLPNGATGTGAPNPGGSPVDPVVTQNTWCGLLPDGRRAYDGLYPDQPINANAPIGQGGPLRSQTGSGATAVFTSLAERVPVPTSVTQYIPAGVDEKVWFAAFYLQDQWTYNRFTLSGALRYDHSQSRFGKTCVGPDLYTSYPYCLNDPADPSTGTGKGVNFQDLTPRWGVAWDIFGDGKTSLKWNMGKYVNGANVGGIYTASNPASPSRTVSSFTRNWKDIDGDRIADCDLTIPAVVPPVGASSTPAGECSGDPQGPQTNNFRRFGRSPNQLDELGLAIGLNTIYCGQDEPSMSQQIRNYCNNYFRNGGKSPLSGWNQRQYEWQFGLGVQRELLPRLSMEVTYNRRWSGNQTINDVIGTGCDLYSQTKDADLTLPAQDCIFNTMSFNSDVYDFYSVQAPLDPRLPGGGGYLVQGIATPKVFFTNGYNSNTAPSAINPEGCTTASPCRVYAALTPSANNGITAVTQVPKGWQQDSWDGVDTNFVLRARGGLRLSGGTSTGRRKNNTCKLQIDDNNGFSSAPSGQVIQQNGTRICEAIRPYQTNVRGTATYTIPWIDVLFSSTFSYRPGSTISANYSVPVSLVIWGENSQYRYDPQFSQAPPNKCSGTCNNTIGGASTVSRNLLSNDAYGEGIRLFDIRLAKNIRFQRRRINIGADVYNIFNSDAALGYCATFPNCGTVGASSYQEWKTVTNITTPRYARFQIQVDF